MEIANNVLKYYLKNVRFITGTAYAGKSTMVKMLADRYGVLACEENYHMAASEVAADPVTQPNLCYFRTMRDWQEFLNRTPEAYEAWIYGVAREAASFEIAELIRVSQNRIVVADTNIPLDVLHEIADYHQVAVMLSPQSMSVDHFFDRSDAEKQFLLEQIRLSDDPNATMANFRACIARVNNAEHYAEYANSGFFTLLRRSTDGDTREETLRTLAQHFQLEAERHS